MIPSLLHALHVVALQRENALRQRALKQPNPATITRYVRARRHRTRVELALTRKRLRVAQQLRALFLVGNFSELAKLAGERGEL